MHEPTPTAAAPVTVVADNGLDKLFANLLMLMSQYTLKPCPHVVSAIVDHMARMYNHPHIDLVPAQKEALSRLARLWTSRLPLMDASRLH